MRTFLLLASALLWVTAVGCAPEYPPPTEIPVEYTACDSPEDCVVVELGCCDECNGGEARSVNGDHANAVIDRYSETCGPGTACTEIGCAAWVTTCERNVCGLERSAL